MRNHRLAGCTPFMSAHGMKQHSYIGPHNVRQTRFFPGGIITAVTASKSSYKEDQVSVPGGSNFTFFAASLERLDTSALMSHNEAGLALVSTGFV